MTHINRKMIDIALQSAYPSFAEFIEKDTGATLEYAINFDGTNEAKERLLTLIDGLFGRYGIIREYHLHDNNLKIPNTTPISKTISILKTIGFGELNDNTHKEQIFLGKLGAFTLTDVIHALEKINDQINDVDGNQKILGTSPLEKHFNMRPEKIKIEMRRILIPMRAPIEHINFFINEIFEYYKIKDSSAGF